MKYYVIMVENYDSENTLAYILDNKLFTDHEQAKNYLDSKKEFVKQQHWTENMDNDMPESYNIDNRHGYLLIEDTYTGQSLEIGTVEVREQENTDPMQKKFPIPHFLITREDLEDNGYNASKLSDDDMRAIASHISKCILEWECDFRSAFEAALNYYNVPLIEETKD